ncbi:Stm1p [Sugiyamaella lignohabitans]|uniref:Stm1p n=1 Tax=Sugiyamaella lignohabitans TaxID=796027 RepID=A0A161HJP9_9ASCO|nr:Stm1p [Sugiyamaella lignohabitans]ANB12977.1 Stm1p [Sugiyamaella lignohabitans]
MKQLRSHNPFALLDDEDSPSVPVSSGPVKEVVKNTTSSKKADAAPARANPARATGNKKPLSGNEAALKDKNVGRANNRSRGGAEGETPRSKTNNRRFDRHSQTGKTDSDKKVNKAWGDDKKKLDDEAAAESIAKEDATEAESAEAAPAEEEADNTKTLEEYYAELNAKNAELNASRSARKANEGVEDAKWANANEVKKSDEELVPEARSKAVRTKTRKEKTIIEADVSFSGPARPANNRGDRSERPARGGARNGPRRNNANNNNQGRGRAGAQAKVNITSQADFPTLGN